MKRDLTAHLATAVRVRLPSEPVTVDGMPWSSGHDSGQPVQFLAFRTGRLEFLRASVEEKGPFTTAGWGVSQGTIERAGPEIIWTLAGTAIGLGYHTVTTRAGTYVLEVILSR